MEEALLIPVYGFLEGDTIGLLILAHGDEKISDLANKLLSAAGVRIKNRGDSGLFHEGKLLDPDLPIESTSIKALDRIDVRWRLNSL